MRAYRLHEFVGPGAFQCEDVPRPAPGPGEVLVRVRAASLNYRDLLVSKGLYNPKLKRPLVPMSDASGEVVSLGAGAERFRPGDRVVATFAPAWLDGPPTEAKARSALGGEASGVLAEEIVLSEEALLPVPAHLSFEEAATLPCAGVTAWNAVFETGNVRPGDTVLVLGTGGVSIFAAQFAQLAGARVIATTSHEEKRKRLQALGITETINYKTDPDWDKRARELTGGTGVDLVVEVGGAGTLPRSVRAVRAGGTIALIGVLSGAGEFNPLSLLMRSIRLQGIFVGPRRMFESMLRAIETNQLHPIVDRVFPFDQAVAAFECLESGAHFGKVVVAF